tara:strand:- start:2254 stop:2535 length:282 start_codon:yes stop_codon:yes gene_type:complete
MGAHSFYVAYEANNAEQAYNALVQQAIYNHGHDPYNGTISTTDGFRMITTKPDETPRDTCIRAEDLAEKRGECCCWQDQKNLQMWHFAGWAAS